MSNEEVLIIPRVVIKNAGLEAGVVLAHLVHIFTVFEEDGYEFKLAAKYKAFEYGEVLLSYATGIPAAKLRAEDDSNPIVLLEKAGYIMRLNMKGDNGEYTRHYIIDTAKYNFDNNRYMKMLRQVKKQRLIKKEEEQRQQKKEKQRTKA